MQLLPETESQKVAYLWCNWYHRDAAGIWSLGQRVFPSLDKAYEHCTGIKNAS